MQANIELTRGLVFSQGLMLRLVEKGLSREQAYRIVQRNAMEAWKGHHDFLSLCRQDEDLSKHLSAAELEDAFRLDRTVRYVGAILDRVFAQAEGPS
jgi:adenylosuccinate lyase